MQSVPESVIAPWRDAFDAGDEVAQLAPIPDTGSGLPAADCNGFLAVPMMQDHAFRGFVAIDMVRDPRRLLPGEIYLIRSVAQVIVSLLTRQETEAKLSAAHMETAAERTRLQTVLSAMPDLVVTLDKKGRFATWHSGAILIPEDVAKTYIGKTVEEVLPPDLALRTREILSQLDAGEVPETNVFKLALVNDVERRWQLSAMVMGELGYLFVLRDVTEAHEQAIQIARLSEVARRTSNLVVTTDADRRITWVNAAFEETSGWTLDEVRGKRAGAFLQCEDTDPATIAMLRERLDAGQPVQTEILNQSRDGRKYWIYLDIQPKIDARGKLTGFMAVETDVTEQRKQADALREAAESAARAHATLEAAVDALHDGFVLYDRDDRLVICNARYRAIYPHSAPAMVPGARFEDILRYGLERGEYSDAVGREEEWLAERLATHALPESETEQELSSGRWLRVYEKATPDGGRVGLRIDITELKLAEKRALADRSEAMEASGDAISITDAEGRFLYVNRAFLRLYGFSEANEIVGRHWNVLYSTEVAEWITTVAIPDLIEAGHWTGEVIAVAQDGSPVDTDISLTLKDDGGILCIGRDMQERRREASERDKLREQLQLAQRREIIGDMAAGLAHDFNNLLAVISGGAMLIGENAEKGSLTEAGVSRIQAATDRAEGLVKRLLALGRHEANRVTLDLRKPLREAADLARAGLRAPTRLKLELPDDPVEVLADPIDVLQVALNLAINARDAMENYAGEITIALTPPGQARTEGPFALGGIDPSLTYCQIDVRDTGPGMTPELREKVFQAYVTTKGEKGSGLGLAVVSSIITAERGALRLISAPGVGTRFEILWPVAQPKATVTAPAPGTLTGRLDGRMILVVDDNELVLKVLTGLLESAGAEVAPSTHPEDALDALNDAPEMWDALITDFDMPTMTGADLAQKAHELAPDLPVLLITALAGMAGRNKGEFAAILGKPVGKDALVSTAEAVIVDASKRKGET